MQKAVHPEHDIMEEPAEHDFWADLRQDLSTHCVRTKQAMCPKGTYNSLAHKCSPR